MKCKKCNSRAIANLKQYKIALCEKCYPKFYESLVKRSIKKYGILKKDERILTAVSGGKDSVALAKVLKNLGYEIEMLYIDLGIREYSKRCKNIVEKLSETIDVDLNVLKLSDFGFTIDDVEMRKVCSACGTAKRYLMNKFARENKFDIIATGHTSEDLTSFAIKNIVGGNFGWIEKLKPRIESFDEKIIPKARPLFERMEKENMLYVLTLKLPFSTESCPNAPINDWKEIVYEIERRKIGFNQNFVRGLINAKKLAKLDVKYCKICGEVTTSDMCAFCKLVKRYSKN
ncbi:MAG TPA: adenine nucleotide alpha hydrolase family protein [Archaeoglobus veneficus]|nr:adenine nucleotide alpha hydrolase family protein [Archaeoglobus veneficus]